MRYRRCGATSGPAPALAACRRSCEIKSREVFGRRGEVYVGREIGNDELERFVTGQASALEELQRRFGLSDREVRRRLKEVNKYYRKALR